MSLVILGAALGRAGLARAAEGPPLPACGGALTEAEVAAVVWHLLNHDGAQEVAACIEALGNAQVEQVVAAMAALPPGLAWPGAPTVEAVPGAGRAGAATLAATLAAPESADAAAGQAWRQWIERGSKGCPRYYDCAAASWCWWSQAECDDDEDNDLVCLFSFERAVSDPDSARAWADGSGRAELMLKHMGGLNGMGHTDSGFVRGCLGDFHVNVLGGGVDNVRAHLSMRHLPPGTCSSAVADCL